MSHARLLIPDPRDSRWDTAHQRCIPIIPPRSVLTLRRHKAGQGHLKVHEMQHDRTSLTYACVTVEQIDDWWQSTMSSGEARKHSIRNTDFIALYLNVLLLFVSAQEKKKKKKTGRWAAVLNWRMYLSVYFWSMGGYYISVPAKTWPARHCRCVCRKCQEPLKGLE